MSTLAGSATWGYKDGLGAAARFDDPCGMTIVAMATLMWQTAPIIAFACFSDIFSERPGVEISRLRFQASAV